MAQVTIYIDNELESKIKNIAQSLNIPIGNYISMILEKSITDHWGSSIKKLPGSWNDFPTAEELRENNPQDITREAF